uniref:Cyclin N-terminal domain-containing protein n=2 Tax=Wuchereria bancrofti TaxID=6293 RepID=A0AAF5PZD4_WUCBA
MHGTDKKRRSLLNKTAESSEPPVKYRRITEENCRSAKIIESERRLSDNAKLPPESSANASDVEIYNDPSNFLSCGCLGSPRQVWHILCNSRDRLDERRVGRCKIKEVKGIHFRITALLLMMQLCEHMEYRRETYHRAIDIFDRVMTVFDFANMDRGDIIFTGIFVVFIASKLEERQKNHWKTIADYVRQVSPRGRLETENMFELEMKIITSVSWSLRTITALEWAKIYTHMTRVYTIYKRICNLTLAHQSTPTKKRTRITLGVSDDEEVDFFTWAELDDLVIGEPSSPGDWNNRIAIAQVLDLCTADLYSFNFTYRQLGAAACISVLGLNYEIAARITGLEMEDLRPALDFVNSYRRIYMEYVHKEGVSLAVVQNDDPLHGLEESDEDEEIEVVENRDDKPSVPESIQNVENVQPKMLKTKIIFPTPKSYSKCKPDHETLKTSGFINEMSENIGKVSEEQGPSNASPKFTKKSRIFVSDTEVSLLEININSPSFRNISIEANIPEQQRLRILSSKSENKKEISRPINFIFMKKKQLPTALSPVVANIFQHPPPETQALPLQVPVSHATSATNRAANAKIIDKRCKKIIEMECECGCGKRDVIDDKLELERMISLFSHQKGEGKAVAKLFISKRNQWGETEISREIAIPHPIEVLEKQMGKFYTQSFPLEAQITHRVIRRLQRFWLACENSQPCKRRHSHSAWQNRRINANVQRRKSR